jgi:hypothetical protein
MGFILSVLTAAYLLLCGLNKLSVQLDKLIAKLRDPASNLRWLFGHFGRAVTALYQGWCVLNRHKSPTIRGASKQWGVAYIAYETFFISMVLILNLLQSILLLCVAYPALMNGDVKRIVLAFLASAFLGWSLGWCTKVIRNNRKSLHRYWPTLSLLQKLQSLGTLSAVSALVILISTGNV